jgi:hypothetical protein
MLLTRCGVTVGTMSGIVSRRRALGGDPCGYLEGSDQTGKDLAKPARASNSEKGSQPDDAHQDHGKFSTKGRPFVGPVLTRHVRSNLHTSRSNNCVLNLVPGTSDSDDRPGLGSRSHYWVANRPPW